MNTKYPIPKKTCRTRNNKLTRVLLYAVLEWSLICCLFLYGLFGYLISKFAAAAGLEPPCLFCARVDHLFEPSGGPKSRPRKSCREFLCDKHAAEVAKLGFCSAHGRLAEAAEMCEDCSAASRPAEPDVVSWMQRSEQGEKDLRCACCDVILESGFYYLPFKLGSGEDGFDERIAEVDGGKISRIEAVFPEERLEEVGVVSGKVLENCVERGIELGVEGFNQIGDHEFELVSEKVSGVELGVKELGFSRFGDFEGERVSENCVGRGVELGAEKGGLEVVGEGEERFGDYACCVIDDALLEGVNSRVDDVYDVDRLVPVELIDEATVRKSPVGIVLCRECDREIARDGEERGFDAELDDKGDDYGCLLSELDDVLRSVPEEEIASSFVVEKVCDIGESSSLGVVVEEADLVLDFVNTAKKESALVSFEEVTVIDEVNCSRDYQVEQVASLLEVGHEKDETVSSVVETNGGVMEMDSLAINDVEGRSATLDIGAVTDEEKEFDFTAKEMHVNEEDSLVLDTTNCLEDASVDCELDLSQPVPETSYGSPIVHVESFVADGTEDVETDGKLGDDEVICETLPDTDISKLEHIAQAHPNESIFLSQAENDQLSLNHSVITDIHQVIESETAAFAERSSQHIALSLETSEIEEERLPETPTQIDGIHSLHKRFMFGRRDSGTESLDGSVASDFESFETSNVDQLKSALRAEQKSLAALYAELEEERNASAIAANQTMAMITRLQEEKASMQMETLQYQRMMEEQSEYDQELLHHLNELLVEKEKDKQDLEEELEVYRKKYLRYKAYKRRMVKITANGKSRASSESSGAEESDDFSLELDEGNDCADRPNGSFHHTPLDFMSQTPGKVQATTDGLILPTYGSANLHDERHSILEKLSALEERLLALEDEDDLQSNHPSYENGHLANGNHEAEMSDECSSPNAVSDYCNGNGNGKPHSERRRVSGGKRLLPLFDAVRGNGCDASVKEVVIDASSEAMEKLEQDKLAIVDKIEIISERLQALEADREFLKRCVSSLNKGDEAMHLLQEIVEQLRDLKSVELQILKNRDASVYLATMSVK